MSKKETAKLMKLINDFYPKHFKDMIEEDMLSVIGAWHSVLDDIDYDKAVKGLMHFVKESSYPPTVADIRANVEPEYRYLSDTGRG